MLTVLLIFRLTLAGIFLLAGLSKLADPAGSKRSLVDFGLPAAIAKAGAILLPLLEIAVAFCLLPARLAWYGALGALLLLTAFILAIAAALAQGRKPDCHCFGQLHSKPVGWDLMARNVALALLPFLLLYHGADQPGFSIWVEGLTPAVTLLLAIGCFCLALLVFQSWFQFQLMRQGGRMLLRLEALEQMRPPAEAQPEPASKRAAPALQGLPVGQEAPAFTLTDLDGQSASLGDLLLARKPAILLFTHPGCGPCNALLPEVAAWQAEHTAHFTLALISQGDVGENRAKAKEHKLRGVFLQNGQEISAAYQAYGTPAAVLIRPDGKIGSAVAGGAEAIRSLVAATVNESLASLVPIQVREGEKLPPLVYPDLDGEMFSLSQLRGSTAVLLFWNPGCGYCQQMAADVRSWERHASTNGVKLLVISSGSVEDNRRLKFRSRVVIDANFSAGRAFGAGGTPSGLRLDSEGRVVSKLAVGRQQILDSIFEMTAAARV